MMKYLKEYSNWDSEKITGDQLEDAVKECFIEFEDRGWYWKTYSSDSISQYNYPNFLYTMIETEYEYVPAHSRNEYIDWTGDMMKNGEIKWDTKDLTFKNQSEYFQTGIQKVKEEAEDFLTSIKRINEMTGQDFSFSYNNRGGELKIIIMGKL